MFGLFFGLLGALFGALFGVLGAMIGIGLGLLIPLSPFLFVGLIVWLLVRDKHQPAPLPSQGSGQSTLQGRRTQ
jgi:hypothetical protein